MGQKVRKVESGSELWIEKAKEACERNDIRGADHIEIEEWINADGKYYYKARMVKGDRMIKDILGDGHAPLVTLDLSKGPILAKLDDGVIPFSVTGCCF